MRRLLFSGLLAFPLIVHAGCRAPVSAGRVSESRGERGLFVADDRTGFCFDVLGFIADRIDVSYYASLCPHWGLRSRAAWGHYKLGSEDATHTELIVGVNRYFRRSPEASPYLFIENGWWKGDIEGTEYLFHETVEGYVARIGFGYYWGDTGARWAFELAAPVGGRGAVPLPAESSWGHEYVFRQWYVGIKTGF